MHVAHALLQRGGCRALVFGADAVAEVVDAEREKAEEELLDRAGVEMARLHVRDARTQRAALAGLLEPLRVLVGNARNAFEHVRVELVPVADCWSTHRFSPIWLSKLFTRRKTKGYTMSPPERLAFGRGDCARFNLLVQIAPERGLRLLAEGVALLLSAKSMNAVNVALLISSAIFFVAHLARHGDVILR